MSARYRAVWKDGRLLAEYEGDRLTYLAPEYQSPKRSDAVSAPMIIRDIAAYRSPVDNSIISSRSMHRDHIKAHDLIEVGNEPIGHTKPPETPLTREFGERLKHHLDEVKALPQAVYDERVKVITNGPE